MSVLYCGKPNKIPYYIKEADLNIRSIEELAYFIYNYAILISNSFITKNLIVYIDKVLGLGKLANEVNDLYNKKGNLASVLTHILISSNFYNDDEISQFRIRLLKLLSLPEDEYIHRAGDKLFKLKKYEKAIAQYAKIAKTSDSALKRLAFCYAKLQFYDTAADYLGKLYRRTRDIDDLKEAYFALKLNGTVDKIYDYESNINDELLADWELEIVTRIIMVRKSEELKNIESTFLMGQNDIKENISNRIRIWKDKYRYIG